MWMRTPPCVRPSGSDVSSGAISPRGGAYGSRSAVSAASCSRARLAFVTRASTAPVRDELGGAVSFDATAGDGVSAPELHDPEAVREDRERRVGAGEVGPRVGEVVAERDDDVDHLVERPVDVEEVVLERDHREQGRGNDGGVRADRVQRWLRRRLAAAPDQPDRDPERRAAKTPLPLRGRHAGVVGDAAHEVGRVGAGGREEPTRRRPVVPDPAPQQQRPDECVAIAHRSEQQARGGPAVLVVAPQAVRRRRRDQEAHSGREADGTGGHRCPVLPRVARNTQGRGHRVTLPQLTVLGSHGPDHRVRYAPPSTRICAPFT